MRKSVPKHVGSASRTMADQLGVGSGVMELKLGQSFTSKNSASFHTLRYDFKPASVDMTKKATVAVGENHQVTVTVPHMDGAGTPQTIFKGSHRPYKKECVLIFDRKTGEVTLEKLTHNMQVKKTRSEPKHNKQVPFPQHQEDIKPPASKQPTRSGSGNQKKTSASSRPKNHRGAQAQQMASSLSTVVPRHSPLHASPSYPQKKSPHMPVAASLPVIGELTAIKTAASPTSDTERSLSYGQGQQSSDIYLSESSSDSSDESGAEGHQKATECSPSYNNGRANAVKCRYSPGAQLLNEDLQLSESGSDD
ncbi:ELL-associated factor 1-like isoform X1 [Schistocerca nitens]|uniref:ELL-associated factor 1-like isoform X1 n=1 Tax=Schistocerca nitens TaxID=7011 RepID=UPI002117E88F|nr:ELL-associated factor 1-like isoform X1 [Schistocerca nitens]